VWCRYRLLVRVVDRATRGVLFSAARDLSQRFEADLGGRDNYDMVADMEHDGFLVGAQGPWLAPGVASAEELQDWLADPARLHTECTVMDKVRTAVVDWGMAGVG
jgi:hypothetical protein